jgi:hypothetical protein
MNTRNILSLTLSTLTVAAAAPTATLAGTASPAAQHVRPGGVIQALNAPDMAVRSLDFMVVRRTGPGTGRVEIRGTAYNAGRTAYATTAHPELQLKENGRVVARAIFGNVAPGQKVEVKFQRDWTRLFGKAINYQLVVAYDPNDWGTDGNSANNQTSRPGHDIDALLQ